MKEPWEEEFDRVFERLPTHWCPDCATLGTGWNFKDNICGNCGKTRLVHFKHFISHALASQRETLAVSVEGLKKEVNLDTVMMRMSAEDYNAALTDAAAHIRGDK